MELILALKGVEGSSSLSCAFGHIIGVSASLQEANSREYRPTQCQYKISTLPVKKTGHNILDSRDSVLKTKLNCFAINSVTTLKLYT